MERVLGGRVMSEDAIKASLARLSDLEVAGEPVAPDWVTDPVDREMIRLGLATIKPAVGGWVDPQAPDVWDFGERVVDCGDTPEECAFVAVKRAALQREHAMQQEARLKVDAALAEYQARVNAGKGGDRSAVSLEAALFSLELQKGGMRKGLARMKASTVFGRTEKTIERYEIRIRKEKRD